MRSNCGEVLLARTAALAIGNAGRLTADLRERPSAVLLSRTPRLGTGALCLSVPLSLEPRPLLARPELGDDLRLIVVGAGCSGSRSCGC
jgi:hypothetical protein